MLAISNHCTSVQSAKCPTLIFIFTLAKGWERHGSAILFPSLPKAGKFHLIQNYSMASVQAERLETDGGWMLYSKLPPCFCPSIPTSLSPTPKTQASPAEWEKCSPTRW